ncbi:MAG: zinc-binding alcohol dehydrogenase [Acuticoccus sp.]
MEDPAADGNLGSALALWCQKPLTYARLPVSLGPLPPGAVVLEAVASAISRGTERLVLEGAVPPSEHARMRCPHQQGEFPFPVKYGYALVGRVAAGPPALRGRLVFALHPHQTRAVLPAEAVVPVPQSVPAVRATLAANMETALNVVWDAGIAPCDRVLVAGAGVVGLLVAHLAAKIPGTAVTVVDTDPAKGTSARALGAAFAAPADAPQGVDVAINASGSGAGLATALAAAGREATVVEASWHGANEVTLPLGGAFHSQRLKIVSSQVGALPAARAARWTHARRLGAAIGLLEDPALDTLISHTIPFAEAPDRLPPLLTEPGPLAIVLTYDAPAP